MSASLHDPKHAYWCAVPWCLQYVRNHDGRAASPSGPREALSGEAASPAAGHRHGPDEFICDDGDCPKSGPSSAAGLDQWASEAAEQLQRLTDIIEGRGEARLVAPHGQTSNKPRQLLERYARLSRSGSTDERSSEQQPKVRPSTEAGRHFRRLLVDMFTAWQQFEDVEPVADPTGFILAIEAEAGAELSAKAERTDRLEAALRHALKFANRIYEQREWSESDLLEIIHAADDALGEAEASEETGR